MKFDRDLAEALRHHARAETRKVGFRIPETDGDADYLLLAFVGMDLRSKQPDGAGVPAGGPLPQRGAGRAPQHAPVAEPVGLRLAAIGAQAD